MTVSRLPRDSSGRAWPRTDPGNPEWEGPWCCATLTCPVCGEEEVCVYPACAPQLECDGCGYMIPAPPFSAS